MIGNKLKRVGWVTQGGSEKEACPTMGARRADIEALEEPCRNELVHEHKTAVKRNDPKTGIVVHSWTNQHQVNWEATTVRLEEGSY